MKKKKNKVKEYLPLYLMMLPGLLYLLINNYLPMTGIILAFKKLNFSKGILASPWAGLDNFKFLFSSKDAWIITRNTLLYNIAFILVNMVVGIAIAILICEVKNTKMKKIIVSILAMGMAFSLAACGSKNSDTADKAAETNKVTAENKEADKPENITIQTLNGNKESVEMKVPYDPQRIAVLDMASLDILDSLNLGDRVVGAADTSLDYLQDYVTNENITNLGTIKEADLEAVMSCEPDVIFIGGRLAASYDALSEIAPVVYLSTDTEIGLVESVNKNVTTIASMFGMEDQVNTLMKDFDSRIEKLSAFAEGKTAIIGMCTSGGFNVLGNDGRCSLIGKEVGFENIGTDANIDTSTHGNEASFEFVVEKNPDYIFVMDRDAAIGTDGAKLAQDIMENELIMGTDAYKNGNLVYLEHPAVWYTAEGGVHALNLMLQDLENALLK